MPMKVVTTYGTIEFVDDLVTSIEIEEDTEALWLFDDSDKVVAVFARGQWLYVLDTVDAE